MGLLKKLYALLSSYGLAALLLVFLLLLTWLGTLEQVEFGLYETQKKYFESLFLIHEAGPFAVRLPFSDPAKGPLMTIPAFPVPLPGVYLLLSLLVVNLVLGGMVRLRKDRSRAGILITHFGILFMLAAGFVEFRWSHEGVLQVFPQERSRDYYSYHEWDITVRDADATGRVREHVIPSEEWRELAPGATHRFTHDALPFDVLVTKTFRNCRVVPQGPMFKGDGAVIDGYVVLDSKPEMEQEFNVPGAYLTIAEKTTGRQTDAIVWGRQMQPLTVDAGGKRWLIDLGKRRHELPFDIQLDKFIVEFHPGTSMARTYWSNITKFDGGQQTAMKITMNEPLRHQGYTLFQTNWGPQDGNLDQPLYSVFTVVENPSDQWPKWSCYVIAVGLLLHFSLRLKKYVASTRRPAPAPAAPKS
ncbi:MAG: cytochrome c biogenesis protein ResB [Planctomycetes bacterium]|nr:cytochrome c biogenesis protein ResB [Planctomycetota bacterium]